MSLDPAEILDRARQHGANIVLRDGALRIINERKLPAGSAAFIAQHHDALARFLSGDEREERIAIIVYEGKTPREWAEQFVDILAARRPEGVSDTDWTWFLTTAGRIIDEAPPTGGRS